MTENHKDIAIKAWEMYQGLAKSMGESAWKIKAVCFAMTSALIAYSYNSAAPLLYLLTSFVCVLFFVLESGYRRLQDQYIEKSISIERTLNDFIANDEHPTFPESIGTDVDTPSFQGLLRLLAVKRLIFWLPYLVIFLLSILLYGFDIKKV